MSLNIAMLAPEMSNVAKTSPLANAKSAATTQGVPQNDFAQTLASMASDAIATVKSGETTAMAGMQGKAPLQQAVQAVMQAEQALRTVVAVRDKVVGAYQEISRLQI